MFVFDYTRCVNRGSRAKRVRHAWTLLIASNSLSACGPVENPFPRFDVGVQDVGGDASTQADGGMCRSFVAGRSPAGCTVTTRECLRDEFISPDYCVNRDRDPQACATSIANNRWVCATQRAGCALPLGCLRDCVERECPSDSRSCVDRAIDNACAPQAQTFTSCLTRSIESGQCPAYPPEAFVDFVSDAGVDGGTDASRDTSVRDAATDTMMSVDTGTDTAVDAAACFSSRLGQRCSSPSECGGCNTTCQGAGLSDPICCMPLRSACRTASDCCAGGGSTRSCSSAGLCCQGPQGICGRDADCCNNRCMIAPGYSSGLCAR